MKKLLALFVVVLGFSAVSFAQVFATASSSATIIGPIAISKTADMVFGNLAVLSASAGTVSMTANAAATLSPAGGVSTVAGVTPVSAKFTVSGVATYGYSISKPISITLTGPGAPMTLAVTSFPATSSTIPAGGSEIVYVGGTLSVAAGQVAGTYQNTTDLTVTVNYN